MSTWKKWKGQLKAAVAKYKEKYSSKHSAQEAEQHLQLSKACTPSVAAAPAPAAEQITPNTSDSGGLSRPHGLGGRKSLELSPAQQQAGSGGGAGPAGGQQQQQDGGAPQSAGLPSPQQQQQQQPGVDALPQQQQQQQDAQPQRPPQTLNCHARDSHGLDAYLQSNPASPTAATAAATAAAAAAATSSAPGQHQQHQQQPHGSSELAAAAGGSGGVGHAVAAAKVAAQAHHQRVHEASRTPLDEELGSCPPYAAKAVWGLRYTMEDKWAAVPNLLQVPHVLTSPPKRRPAASRSPGGCGCMLAPAQKVLAKVSPSGRSSTASAGGAGQSAGGDLAKGSLDKQRLVAPTHHGSDEPGAGDSAVVAADGSSANDGSGASSSALDCLHYFGVFDGHGGADAARHCAQRMHQVVVETVLSLLAPELAGAVVVSALAGACSSSGPDAVVGPPEQAPDDPLPSPQPQADTPPAGAQQQQQQAHEGGTAPASSGAQGGHTGATDTAAAAAGAAAAAAAVPAPPDILGSGGAWLQPALTRAFVALDHEFGALSEGSYVGSTAVVVLVGGQRMWVAHCGDSRAVLGRSGGQLQVLTSDHKASRGDEVARVQAAGGHVWWDRVMGELAVSRAIGDHCLRPYVIPEPETCMLERTPGDEVLVLASDGLWDVIGNQEAVDMALHALQAAEASGHAGVAAAKRSANALTKAALERGTRDNVTVLVVDLRPHAPGSIGSAAAAAQRAAGGGGSHHGQPHRSSTSSSRAHGSSHRSSRTSSSATAATTTNSSSSSSKKAAATPAAAAGAAGGALNGSSAVGGGGTSRELTRAGSDAVSVSTSSSPFVTQQQQQQKQQQHLQASEALPAAGSDI